MKEDCLTPAQWATSGTADDLPEPSGYRMLVKPHEIESVSKGGIVLVEESKQYADVATYIGLVVKQGPECYSPDKFNSRWCEVDDYVMFARNVGQKIEIKRGADVEKFVLINDADVRARVKDPSAIRMYL